MNKLIVTLSTLLLFSCHRHPEKVLNKTLSAPVPDHIILIWFENKAYNQIINNKAAAYINSLQSIGTRFDSAFALCHPSYPNYVAFFSGKYQGVRSDACIEDSSLNEPNLYSELLKKNVSFRWYSEGLPQVGSSACKVGRYVEKHNPTSIFSNVDKMANAPFSALPTDSTHFDLLPRVSCVTPDLVNDMHDGPVAHGDAWLQQHFASLINWSLTHNSIVVIYCDEDNGTDNNHIPVLAIGQHIKQGYQSKRIYNHYSFTKTICQLFRTPSDWIEDNKDVAAITDIWR